MMTGEYLKKRQHCMLASLVDADPASSTSGVISCRKFSFGKFISDSLLGSKYNRFEDRKVTLRYFCTAC